MTKRPSADRNWIESVVNAHERPLTIYAARMTGDADRARDIVQDAFLKLWQADREQVEGHVTKWLYTVCRNRALDVRRKEHRMTRLETNPAAATATATASDTTGRAVAYVASLPARQQEAVRLKFQGGLSYREIAEVMETSVSNVGVLLHTAIKTIRGQMTDAEPSATPAGGRP